MSSRKTQKSRGTFGIVDILLIFLALAAFLSVVIYFHYRKKASEGERDLVCLLRIPSVERSLLDAHGGTLIPAGSVVKNERGTVEMGRVERVSVTEHMNAIASNEGILWVADAACVDLEVTVYMRGLQKEGDGIRVKDLRVAAGGRGAFRFGCYYATGVEVLSVEVLT